jgi:hypothetical protein
MSQEGGSLIRPLFLDFATNGFSSELMEKECQFMVGSNLMVFINPKSFSNETDEYFYQNSVPEEKLNYNDNDNYNYFPNNNHVRDKFNNEESIFFPAVPFYNFFTGEILNRNSPLVNTGVYTRIYNTTILKLSPGLNLFLRGGLITPVQNLDMINLIYSNLISNKFDLSEFENFNHGESLTDQKILNFIPDLKVMKNRPIELIVSLDSNLRATGRILFDDGYSSDSQNKKLYYKMEIVAANINDNFVLSFHVNSYKYKPKENEYPYIQQIVLYGYTRLSVKKISLISKLKRLEINRAQYKFEDAKEVLKITNLNIRMDIDNKLIIS